MAIISRRINAVSITDYFKARYNSPAVVILCGLCLVVFFITQMVAQFIGGATLVETVTGLPYWAGLALFGVIVILYTSTQQIQDGISLERVPSAKVFQLSPPDI